VGFGEQCPDAHAKMPRRAYGIESAKVLLSIDLPQGQIASFDLFEGWVGSIVWVVKPTFGPGLNVLDGIEAFIINLGSFLFCEWSLGFIDLL
jgi:hypothetical protein